MRCFWIGWATLLALTATLPAPARDVLVSNTQGDDRARGLRWEPDQTGSGPVQTLGRALDLAVTGDRIVLAPTGQPYRESITLSGSQHSGPSAQQPFLIVGNGATLDGSAPVPPRSWKYYHDQTFVFQPRLLGHQRLFLGGVPAAEEPVAAGAAEPPRLEPLHWCLFRGAIYFAVENDKLPGDYPLTFAQAETGITLVHVRNVAIVDLTVQGFRLDGINAANSARDVRLVSVTVRGNGRAGVVAGGASQIDLDGCLLGNNGEAQLITWPWSSTSVRRSTLLGTQTPAWIDRGGRFFLGGKEFQGGLEAIPVPQ